MTGVELIRAQRGLQSKIARACGILPSAVCQWRVVPAERVVDVERVSGIPRELLRPDLFRPPEQDPA